MKFCLTGIAIVNPGEETVLVNPSGFDTTSVELSLVTSELTKTKNLQILPKGMVEVDVRSSSKR